MIDLHNALIAGRMIGGNGGSPAPEPVLIEKTITQNGTYNAASDNVDGYSGVTVNVPGVPVTFLKSVKSEGNSVVITDIIPQFTDEIHMTVKFSGSRRSTSGTDCFFGVQGSGPWFLAANPADVDISVYIGFDYTSPPGLMYSGIESGNAIPLVLRRYAPAIAGIRNSNIPSAISGDPQNFGFSVFGVSYNSTRAGRFGFYDMTVYDLTIISSSGAVKHHLVPAQSNSTGRGGLYDIVTGTFYGADSRYDDVVKEV